MGPIITRFPADAVRGLSKSAPLGRIDLMQRIALVRICDSMGAWVPSALAVRLAVVHLLLHLVFALHTATPDDDRECATAQPHVGARQLSATHTTITDL